MYEKVTFMAWQEKIFPKISSFALLYVRGEDDTNNKKDVFNSLKKFYYNALSNSINCFKYIYHN